MEKSDSGSTTDVSVELFEYIIKTVFQMRKIVIIIREGHKGVVCFNMVTTKNELIGTCTKQAGSIK